MVAAGLQIQANIIWSSWFVIAVCLKINQHLKFQIWKSNTKSLCFIIYIHWLILEKAEFEEVNHEFYSFQNLHCSRIAHNLKVKKVNATHLRVPRTLPIIRFQISNVFFSFIGLCDANSTEIAQRYKLFDGLLPVLIHLKQNKLQSFSICFRQVVLNLSWFVAPFQRELDQLEGVNRHTESYCLSYPAINYGAKNNWKF